MRVAMQRKQREHATMQHVKRRILLKLLAARAILPDAYVFGYVRSFALDGFDRAALAGLCAYAEHYFVCVCVYVCMYVCMCV
jgi:hypothetical protein